MSDKHGEPETRELETGASRRAWLAGAGAIGVTAVLAACGTEEPGSPGTPPTSTGGGPGSSSAPAPEATGDDDTSGDDTGGDSEALASADEVEVGGGVILASESVVITQPTAGNFKGFSAACTHEGCTVGSISDGIIQCPCHLSQFSIEDGSVVNGPATQPLPERAIVVENGSILLA